MPFRATAALCLSACLFLAGPAWAQAEGQDEADGEIVVTGRAEAPTSTEVSRQARSITMGGDFRHSPLARFEDPLCPGVMGLRPDHAALVIDRIRYQAERLDIRLTKDDGSCAPNFIVAFVPDGKRELEALYKQQGWMFSALSKEERQELLQEDGPVRVWTTTQMRTRDGMPVPKADGLANPPVVSMWMAHSKIYLPIRQDIGSVIVLYDLPDMVGKTLVQLADYATMRGLARTRPVSGQGQAMDTILALFDREAPPPPELTSFDQAYLASIYDSIPNLPGTTKLLGVNRQLRKLDAAAARP